jgi:hypothetical protein
MAEQLLNGILTTLAAAITSTTQTTGIQVAAVPSASITGTVRMIFGGGGTEVVTFTGYTGTGPYTLTGVTRQAEGVAATYASGSAVGIGAATAGVLSLFEQQVNKNAANGYAGLDSSGNLVGPIVIYEDTAANLATLVPLAGQQMFATDSQKLVVGDGATTFANLSNLSSLGTYVSQQASSASTFNISNGSATVGAAAFAASHLIIVAENSSNSSHSLNFTISDPHHIGQKLTILAALNTYTSTGIWGSVVFSNFASSPIYVVPLPTMASPFASSAKNLPTGAVSPNVITHLTSDMVYLEMIATGNTTGPMNWVIINTSIVSADMSTWASSGD